MGQHSEARDQTLSPKCEIDHKDSDVYAVLCFYLLCKLTKIGNVKTQSFSGWFSEGWMLSEDYSMLCLAVIVAHPHSKSAYMRQL